MDLAIIIPCYNEGHRLEQQAFLSDKSGARFLFVNDGSKDNTAEILAQICQVDPCKFSFLSMAANSGKAEAVRQGFLAAMGRRQEGHTCQGWCAEAGMKAAEAIGFWDADLATPLAEIGEFASLLEVNQALEMVLGSRVCIMGKKIVRKHSRHYISRIFATTASCILGLPIYDTQCGAKLFRNNAALASVMEKPFTSKWIFDVEIIARYLCLHGGQGMAKAREWAMAAIYEHPLSEWMDKKGSKVGISAGFRAIVDLATIWRTYFQVKRG